MDTEWLKNLPKVDDILEDNETTALISRYGRKIVRSAVRQAVENRRQGILAGRLTSTSKEEVILEAAGILADKLSVKLRRVINATGTVLHTNLGRARLSERAVLAVSEVAGSYSNLEYDLGKGLRGERYDHVAQIICELTGCESAVVVNNNAAAVLLALAALAKGKRVIVSRGEQVEIGGMFRIPEIMEQSGSVLVEVGTTNKTHCSDYENSLDENSVLLKVHTSNFKIVGFTEDVPLKELAKLAKSRSVPLIYDLGSGALIDFERYGISGEPGVVAAVRDGADIICFSGDKLLGGPQAGIIIGKKKFIDIIKKHPLIRALRVDKMTLAALSATLLEYYDDDAAVKNIPTLNCLLSDKAAVRRRAEVVFDRIMARNPDFGCELIEDKGTAGGGSMPGLFIDTYCLAIRSRDKSPNGVEALLRKGRVPVIARISGEAVIIDMLTVCDGDIDALAEAVFNAAQ